MDGGIHALKGFIYQATVILDVLLPHFESRSAPRARPEGVDDLELSWTEGGLPGIEYVQIKKPREDDQGRLKEQSWTLREVSQGLLPSAFAHLEGNSRRQRWILGDDVEPGARALLAAGQDAPTLDPEAFLHVVHLLARDQSGVVEALSTKDRQSIGQWRFQVDASLPPPDALTKMIEAFAERLTPKGVPQERLERYEQRCRALAGSLPGILARIRLEGSFGLEAQVKERVVERLSRTYPLSRERIADTIWGNMRSFVDDVAANRGRWIERHDLDGLVARAWPT